MSERSNKTVSPIGGQAAQGVRRRAKKPAQTNLRGTAGAVGQVAQFPEQNPNPVLRIGRDGTVMYANPAAKSFLSHWNAAVGRRLAAEWTAEIAVVIDAGKIVEREVPCGERIYSCVLKPITGEQHINVYAQDITNRKQAEEALRRLNAELERRVREQTGEIRQAYETAQSERQRLYDVLDTLPAYVVLLSKDYHVPFANRFFEERFGKSNGRRCYEYLFQRAAPCENCESFQPFKTGEPHRWQWLGPDGRNYSIHDFPFTDSDGSPLVLEMGIDVTEQKRAEAALEEVNRTLEQRVELRTAELVQANERLLAEIEERRKAEAELMRAKEQWERTFNTVPDLIAILDKQHRITQINRAMAQALGTSPEKCIGLCCFQCVHGTDAPPKFCPHSCTMLDGQEHTAEVHEERLESDFLVSTTPMFGPHGELIGSVHVARNITELKRAETRLQKSQEDLNRAQSVGRIGSWRLDVRRNVLLWSAENHRIFGVPEGTPLTYDVFLETVHPDDRAMVDQQWSAALKGAPYDVEHRIVVGGRIKWIRERAELEFDQHGELLGGFGTSQDVTERKLAEQALRELNETLEQRVAERTAVAERRARELGRLSAELSRAEHNERKRLASILHDNLQQLLLAARLRLSGVGRGKTDAIPAEIGAVDELLGECLGVSRDLTLELSPPILHRGTLGEAFEWLGGWFREKHGFQVEVSVAEGLPMAQEAVRVLLFHAARELLANAMKHSGSMEARLLAQCTDHNLSITVEDRGDCFDSAAVERKLEQAQTFGLLNIRERLDALQGRLEIERTPTGGACFRLIVPIPAAEATTADALAVRGAPQTVARGGQQPSIPAGNVRVLVVDDHKVVRAGFVSLLGRESDFSVVGEAADGRQAVEQAETLRPDVVVMDVQMPVMDGVEATRRIKARLPNVLIVGLSLHEEEVVSRAMIQAGAAAFLSKNGPAEELIEVIRRLCGREKALSPCGGE